ncbi:glutaminase A [Rubrobacter indicoceani]|uniref:glutaminase A n=1 Tax=Rubrobacter indicoceani TaxID=2051957 RepID=UPI000E5C02BE|nr:glutaminase A [Rubrobacter indicoceani]
MPTQKIHDQINSRLEDLYRRHREEPEGSVARYYPPEMEDSKDLFAISLCVVDGGGTYQTGDCDHAFPLQSISKVFTYGLALEDNGRDRVLESVGVEPSGDAFNSITFDNRMNRPHNPMVNAGALVTTDLVAGENKDEQLRRILDKLRAYAGNPELEIDESILDPQGQSTDRNRAISYLMRSFGMISDDIEPNLALYGRQCSVHVTAEELSLMAATLANGGVNPRTGKRALDRRYVRDVLSVMHTCGMYDAAGQWAYEVGIPAKSGVSGGILAVVPGKLGLGVFSPGLDDYGNSVRGVRVCREISEDLGLHVFADETEDLLLHAADPEK